MAANNGQTASIATMVRRRVLIGAAMATGGLAVAVSGTAAGAERKTADVVTKESDALRTSLHQEWEFRASPQRIYHTLLDSKQFSAFSGEAAAISPEVGG